MKGVPEGVASLAEALAAGQITARAVVEHYDRQLELNLDEDEKNDLVEYLKSL